MLKFLRALAAGVLLWIAAAPASAGLHGHGAAGGGGGNTLNPTSGSPGQKSPGITLSGGNLIATSTFAGDTAVLALNGKASGTATYTVTINTLVGANDIWVGLATSSHATTDGGNSWAAGDNFTCGFYLQSGTVYSVGSNLGNEPDLAAVAGSVITITANASTSQGTFQVGAGPTHTYACPTGTLYPVVGFGAAGNQATVNLTSFP